MKEISIVFTYNQHNKNLVKSWADQAIKIGFTEIITVNEGNAKSLIITGTINIEVKNHTPFNEPLVMAIGAHYAQGEIVIICREGEQLAKVFTPRRLCSVRTGLITSGICAYSRKDFPWEYEIETGFVRGESGRFINLYWQVNHVPA